MLKNIITITLLFLLSCNNSDSNESNENKLDKETIHFNYNSNYVLIDGYDVVSFQTENKAVQGSSNFKVKLKGVYYWFSNQSNLDLFKENPDKYIPEYGGWCAYGFSLDLLNDPNYPSQKVRIEPNTFKLVDGKLNLFYNYNNNNYLIAWNADEVKFKNYSRTFWANLIK